MSDRYTLISADCHAGGNHEMYRNYLESKYLDDFDAWRAKYSNPFSDLTSTTKDRNWNSERRIAEQAQDGCIAEVIFPNTIPPFFPTGAVIARAPQPDEYELETGRHPGPQQVAGGLVRRISRSKGRDWSDIPQRSRGHAHRCPVVSRSRPARWNPAPAGP